jgi:hypothetical protein
VSPILVRPVREQLEHDRIIRLLQAKYKRKFEVAINPGSEQSAPVGGPPPWYPDLVLLSERRKVLGVVEIETAESVNHLEAMAQWVAFARLGTAFHLYVPQSMIDVARRLCEDMQIPVAELWSYTVIGDQPRFTLVQRSAMPELKGVKPTVVAAAPRPAAPPRAAAHGPTRGRTRTAAPAARRKTTGAAKKTARPASRRAPARKATSRSARPAAKKSASSTRTQKRK